MFDDFDFDDNLPDDTLEQIEQLMGAAITMMTADLPAMLQKKHPHWADFFTENNTTRLATAIHMLAIGFPYPLLKADGFVNVAMIALLQAPEKFNLDAFVDTLHKGFANFSPAFAAAITPEVVILASKMLLVDLLTSPFPTKDELEFDTHFYMNLARKQLGLKPDAEQVGRETFSALQTMTPEEIAEAGVPQELIDDLKSEFGRKNSPYED